MGGFKWNAQAKADMEASLLEGGMERLEAAANIIRDEAKRILKSKIGKGRKGLPISRPAKEGKPIWMEREPGALIETIRVVKKHKGNSRNIWIMAGNYKTWWAVQTEYGRGGWKGGAKSFLRPALRKAPAMIKTVLETGAGQTKGY